MFDFRGTVYPSAESDLRDQRRCRGQQIGRPSQSGGVSLFFEGRLDNRADLAVRLGGEAGPPSSDGELLLALLRHGGVEELSHVLGDFSGALWEEKDRRLTLFCDALRMRQVYYRRHAGRIDFATRIPLLLSMPGERPELDPAVLADYLVRMHSDQTQTCYRGIRNLSAGTAVIFEGDEQPRTYIHWAPDPERRLTLGSDDAYVEAARDLLDQAVACRLGGPGPEAAEMTGGLDSSGVATAAARLLGNAPLRVYTRTPCPTAPMTLGPRVYADETPHVRAIAAMYPNMDLRTCSDEPSGLPPGSLLDPARLFLAIGEPQEVFSHHRWIAPLHDQIVADGCRRLLTGDGGNLFLSFNGERVLYEQFCRGQWWRMLSWARRLARDSGQTVASILRQRVLVPLLPIPARNLVQRLRGKSGPAWRHYSAISEEAEQDHRISQRFLDGGWDPYRNFHGGTRGSRIMVNARSAARRTVLRRAIWGLDERAPLFDRRLVEFCLAIPPEQFFLNGDGRSLVRRVLAPRLPAQVIANHRVGIQDAHWIARLGAEREQWRDDLERLRHSSLASHLIDIPRIKRLIEDWPMDGDQRGWRDVAPIAMHIGRFILWYEGANR